MKSDREWATSYVLHSATHIRCSNIGSVFWGGWCEFKRDCKLCRLHPEFCHQALDSAIQPTHAEDTWHSARLQARKCAIRVSLRRYPPSYHFLPPCDDAIAMQHRYDTTGTFTGSASGFVDQVSVQMYYSTPNHVQLTAHKAPLPTVEV